MSLTSHDPSVVTGTSGCEYACRSVEECDDHLQALAVAAATARPRHPRLAAKYMADADVLLDRRNELLEAQMWAALQ